MNNDFYHQAIIRSGVKIPFAYIYEELRKHGYECTVLPKRSNSVLITWRAEICGTIKHAAYEYIWHKDLEDEFDEIIHDVIEVFSKAKLSSENMLLMDEALE